MVTIGSMFSGNGVWMSMLYPGSCWNDDRSAGTAEMKAEVYWIAGPWPGRLGIVPRPRGGDWLEDEIQAWRAAGLDIVTSLLTPEEISELDLGREAALALQAGLEFRSFPIPDYGVPSSRAGLIELAGNLERDLEAGKSVAVHCRQGIGRSSVVAASVLIAAGEGADEAFRRIEKARGRPVPDTREQRQWVAEMALEAAASR